MRFKQFMDTVWRWKWWLAVPTLVAATTSFVIVATMPKLYRAATTILVTRQSIPEDIVRSTVTLQIEERMRTLQVQILSRSYLEQIAREFDMIPAGAGGAEIERRCVALRARILPELDKRDLSWFRISVEDVDPNRAAGVANRLASLFIEQNSRMRASQAAGTLVATEGWEERYRIELAKRDAAISEFMQQSPYEMPDQQSANLQLLNAAQTRATQLTSDIQARSDRLVAMRSLQRSQRAVDGASEDGDVRLVTLRRELAELLASYTEASPMVVRKREQVAELTRAGLVAGATSSLPMSLQVTAAQIVTLENEMKALERDRAREYANLEIYRRRINNAPMLQQRLLELTRDYDMVKQQFDTAVAQKQQALRSQDLETSSQGEQFQIQDSALPPAAPFGPSLVRYLVVGLGLGLAIGAGAIAAREFADQTVRDEDEFVKLFPELPVCGVIPSLDVRPEPRNGFRASAGRARWRAQAARVAVWVALHAGVAARIGGPE